MEHVILVRYGEIALKGLNRNQIIIDHVLNSLIQGDATTRNRCRSGSTICLDNVTVNNNRIFT